MYLKEIPLFTDIIMQAASIADILPPLEDNAVETPQFVTINEDDLVRPLPVGVVNPMIDAKKKKKTGGATNQGASATITTPGDATPSTSGQRATSRGTARTWSDHPIPPPSSTNLAVGTAYQIPDIQGTGLQIQDVRTDMEAWHTGQENQNQYLVFYAEANLSALMDATPQE